MTNLVISSGVWPTSWKLAKVVPVCNRNKPPTKLSSYRPIALLSSISKIVEKVLYEQLSKFVESHGILPGNQHGFRKKPSIESAIAITVTKAASAIEKGRNVSLAAYDFSAAFDTIDVKVFMFKISSWASESGANLLVNYLSDGSQQVQWNGSMSLPKSLKYGVRRGSILDPLLFIIITADLPRQCELDGVMSVLYADDTTALVVTDSADQSEIVIRVFSARLVYYSA